MATAMGTGFTTSSARLSSRPLPHNPLWQVPPGPFGPWPPRISGRPNRKEMNGVGSHGTERENPFGLERPVSASSVSTIAGGFILGMNRWARWALFASWSSLKVLKDVPSIPLPACLRPVRIPSHISSPGACAPIRACAAGSGDFLKDRREARHSKDALHALRVIQKGVSLAWLARRLTTLPLLA